MVENFLECNYLLSESKEIVNEFPIRLNPKKIENPEKIKFTSSDGNLKSKNIKYIGFKISKIEIINDNLKLKNWKNFSNHKLLLKPRFFALKLENKPNINNWKDI